MEDQKRQMSKADCTRPEERPQIGPGVCDELRRLLEGGMLPEAILDRIAGILEVISGEIADERYKARVQLETDREWKRIELAKRRQKRKLQMTAQVQGKSDELSSG